MQWLSKQRALCGAATGAVDIAGAEDACVRHCTSGSGRVQRLHSAVFAWAVALAATTGAHQNGASYITKS